MYDFRYVKKPPYGKQAKLVWEEFLWDLQQFRRKNIADGNHNWKKKIKELKQIHKFNPKQQILKELNKVKQLDLL